jgi:tetratricopeptide (TPR) repeat protein
MAAQAFAAHCPDRALCARTGPDLLAMLLPGGAEGQCREIADAAARDLSEVLVSEPVLEHSMDLGPSLGVATYPRDLDGGLSAPGAADQALTIMRRAEYAARVASEHGPGTVFSHEDVKARGGRVMNVLAGGRVTVDLGRAAGAFEGERYLVRDSENAQGVKGEVVLLEVDENESMAEVVHAADPWTPIEPGDGLALVRGKDSSVAQTDGPPQVDERSGLYSYAGFMDLLSRKREIPERFALFLTELPLRAEETDDRALARAASAASEIFGDRADGGRFSLAGMIHFVPEISRQKAKSLAHRLHKKLSGDFGDSVIGVSTHPYLSFLPADALDNCRKAVEYARLLPAPRVGLIDSLALTIAADKLFTAGRLFDAVEGYKLALLADRSNTLARNSLGVGLARAGRLSEAARHFKTVINRDESDVNALYNYGYACLRMGKHDEAENAFRRCLELKPDHVYALVRLGRIALADGRFDKAEKMLGKAESLEGGQGLTSRHLARLALARGRKDEAREHLHQAMIHDPRDAQAMHLMAELYLEEGEDPQIAEALARQSAAIRPEHKPFLKTLARSLEALGKGEEAAAVRARSGSL